MLSRERREAVETSFEEFVRVRWNRAIRVAWALTADAHAAEDLVQEAFAKVWPKWRQVEGSDPVAYLNRTIVNLYLSGKRRRDPVQRLVALPLPADVSIGDEVAQRHALLQAMSVLPAQQKIALVLRYVDDLSTEQAAEAMGVSGGTVKSHCARGREKLRHTLVGSLIEEKR